MKENIAALTVVTAYLTSWALYTREGNAACGAAAAAFAGLRAILG
jgi:hypothetical protein